MSPLRHLVVWAVALVPALAQAADDTKPTDAAVPCFVWYDPCSADYRIDGGSARIVYDLGTSASTWPKSDTYHDADSGDCGNNYSAGSVPTNEDLAFYLGNAHYVDKVASFGQKIRIRIKVREYTSNDCSGSATFTASDQQDWDTATGWDAQHCLADDRLDCAGAYGDPTTACRLPDALITSPGATGTRSYKVEIYSGIGLCGGSDCLYGSTATGCVLVDWVSP